MGWFDGSDEDEDTSCEQKATDIPSHAAADDDDEEEDPLDAYMNSLDNSAPSQSSNRGSGGRLDHDAEEEATSHWEVRRPASSSGSTRLLPPSGFKAEEAGEEDVFVASSSREAWLAMSSTFVRAGVKRTNENAQLDVHDNEEDNNETLQSLAQKHYEMQHTEVTPLEKINHSCMKYPPFRRQFISPTNTESGTAWRTEHRITCSPPIDPILGFDAGVFPEELIRRIVKSGYDSPTLVQCQTLPVAMAGRDGLVTAATGSGKSELIFCIA